MSVAIFLIGHGSSRYPDSAAPLITLAETLAENPAWDEVKVGFMKQTPKAIETIKTISSDIIIIIPVFAGKGYYTDTLIPEALGLSGTLTHRQDQILIYTPPVGCHPMLPGIMACRADGVARYQGWLPQKTSLLLLAHGSQRPGGAGETPRMIARKIEQTKHFSHVKVLFLEQEPWASQWQDHIKGEHIVALPLLIAQGTHASQDIPALFGPADQHSWHIHGRHVALATGLGTEPDLIELIASMANQALGEIA